MADSPRFTTIKPAIISRSFILKEEQYGSPVLAVKDPDSQRQIPTAWRQTIKAIVHEFANHNFQLIGGLEGVMPVSVETANYVRNNIEDYGAELVDIPDETWDTSVCIWNGTHWDALVDLWSRSEGRSDLVLSLQIYESKSGFDFSIYMIYVP